MNVEIRILGDQLALLLKEAGIPEGLCARINQLGAPVPGTSWRRHLTVFKNTNVLYTGEDLSYETNTASAMFLLLWQQHTQKLLRILSINGIPLPDNECLAVEWSSKEEQVIRQLAEDTDLSSAQVLRQALRLYQMYHYQVKEGLTMAWKNDQGQIVPEHSPGCMGD
jgi:hypothetical protein